ncbi:Cell division protein FtsX [Methylophaga frappieri]|uniref:Cell division protein FtsX n=1 Tax=Methylophaga frappieri (strain ATCC BAA-2434 / DSM 25690 / JAM7) TaxID=754477 RepID=I1YFT8_METFJ|nr:permease-like cell division protein FtsX [Methylophaga frappieri]AFJ01781.1 Cell division protein FtsX [Methylophaga frappieri]
MPMFKLDNYLLRHAQVALTSLGELWRQPLSSTMTILVIGIALSLPAGLFVLLKNVEQLSGEWQQASRISVFLKAEVSDSHGQQLVDQLTNWPAINNIEFQSAAASLAEFRQLSGLGEVIDTLPHNPLPAVIIIEPAEQDISSHSHQDLLERLQQLAEVEQAQLDLQWLLRLQQLRQTGERGIAVLAALLSLSVLLVIGNTIRLAILNRQSEIKVIKLVGGTNTFVRRPFLYTGFWYGLIGGLIAWITVLIGLAIISGPINKLALLYESQFSLQWLAGQLLIFLPAAGILLGTGGAWLAVSRHLDAIEPS